MNNFFPNEILYQVIEKGIVFFFNLGLDISPSKAKRTAFMLVCMYRMESFNSRLQTVGTKEKQSGPF